MQDRTAEYRAAIQSLTRIHGRPQNTNKPQTKSEFSQRAAGIARNIAETMQQLQHLTQLAKRKPMLDDKPQEVAELTSVIKQRLGQINESIRGLQGVPTAGSAQVKDHSKNIVIMLQGNLTEVTTNFTQVLEDRTKSIQQHRPLVAAQTKPDNPLYRKKQGAGTGAGAGAGAPSGHYSSNPYESVGADAMGSAADPPLEGPGELLLPQEQTLTLLEDQQSSYLQSRSTAVDAIESTINELGGIFAQLSSMVAEQRETVQRIDANTDDIALNVSGAHRELLKFYSRVSSNRSLMIKSFGLVLVFFFLWVMISG